MNDGVDFDSAKDEANQRKHGLPLDQWPAFDDEPMIFVDERYAADEPRWLAFGRIAGVGHSVAFTIRNGRRRMISFRRAHEKELRRYETP
jgi:uncharacterized protein